MDPHSQQPGISWQRITEALERGGYGPGKGSGAPESWNRYLCPVHEGDGRHHTPSLGIRYDPRQSKTIVRCFAGTRCDDADVLARVGLRVRDMWDRLPDRNPDWRNSTGRRPPAPTQRQQQMSRVEQAIRAGRFPFPARHFLGEQTGPTRNVESYVYRWPNGRVEGAVIRRETPHKHGVKKSFTQRRWNGTEWERTGFAPLPFHLPQLLDGIAGGREIYICEGEKDVLRAERDGQIATCNAMGAGSWKPEHAKWLRGAARVFVVADRDRPGYQHADRVAESIDRLVGEVRVVQARGGKDLSDHFDAGYQIDELDTVPYLDRPRQAPQHPQPRGRDDRQARTRVRSR
ncbi:toprim domain-containing protein [Nocardia cyriacigeorgica]|uniref:toprim domain-containing protein n=1 Tax=Nocardia cyriacigeorgica TaxID=135487 RepID=UPI002458BFAF|nr:toprim domain-containing protein [Nocardia cyriacigeorgica]